MKKVEHLSGLTELRGILSLIVLFSHLDQFHYLFGIGKIGIEKAGMAGHAVTVLFVLSGFLITHLLHKEKQKSKKIDIKKFYWRRILRIWPVYFLVVLISFFFYFFKIDKTETKSVFGSVVLYLTMLANFAYVWGMSFRASTVLWSVGVEEQFYAIWPWIFNTRFDKIKSLITIIVVYFIIRIAAFVFFPTSGVYQIIKLIRIDCMAIGGLVALLVSKNHWIIKEILFHPIALLISILGLFFPVFLSDTLFANLEIEIYAIFSIIFILNISMNKKSIIKLNSKILEFFGQMSYGVYCLHMIVFILLSPWLKGQPIYMIYIVVPLVVFIVSYLSYNYYEKAFLKRKKKFVVIESRSKRD